MKKVFGQTVRDIKREVNKKVLKVPGIEQKVLDATSNEPWGPHGTLLADIAQATRNYHEYQMIMSVLWKRISDTGKNWRHVYKALTVLEYLVAHGSERVIDDIREHAYQISTLSGFQYIDSSGRDQGSNVRKKSQSLVVLVNDKERIVEVRQKAVANREKFRTSSTGGMYRPGSYGDRYDDDRHEGRYGSRDDDRNGNGREREWGSRDDERYSRNGDSYGRDGDRYGRDYEDRYGRDGYKDDDYRGRSRSSDEYQNGSRSRSSDRDRDRHDDDSQYSSRRNGARADDQSQNGGEHGVKFSEQNSGAPPSYEEAVSDSRSPVQSERGGEIASPSAAIASPHVSNNPHQEATTFNNDASSENQRIEPSDEFDPRGSVVTPVSAPQPTSSNHEMDLLGSLSDSFSSNALAIMPATSATSSLETDAQANFGSGPTYAATTPSSSNVTNQAFEDPFGDTPFKAIPSTDSHPQPQPSTSAVHFQPTVNQNVEQPQLGTLNSEAGTNFGFGDSFSAITYPASSAPGVQPPTNSHFLPQEPSNPQQDIDILADILPPSGPQPPVASQAPFSSTGHLAQPNGNYYGGFQPQASSVAPVAPNNPLQTQTGAMQGSVAFQTQNVAGAQFGSGNFHSLGGSMVPQYSTGSAAQFSGGNFLQQQGSQVGSQSALRPMSGTATQHNSDMLGSLHPQAGPKNQVATQPMYPSSAGSLAIVAQPSKEKFETKSTVWADTLSRGLVDLNISGSKTNPLADIGVDFEAINRKEKRMEKPAATPVTSTITMGKAMGSGSGMGRAGASVLRPGSNPMMGSGMGMGMGMGGGGGGYGGMSQPMGGMGMGGNMGMGMGMNPGMGMNMRMGPGVQMQPPMGLPPGSTMPGGYNPMMGQGGYAPQQPYGGGYR